MVRMYGLSHIGLAVRDAERSFRFYREVFGVREVWREAGSIRVQTPGATT
jgi:catechol 2,3-dioxygenase-like lactoylglutathione lyase family enzyme